MIMELAKPALKLKILYVTVMTMIMTVNILLILVTVKNVIPIYMMTMKKNIAISILMIAKITPFAIMIPDVMKIMCSFIPKSVNKM